MEASVQMISILNQTSIEWFLVKILVCDKGICIRRNLSLWLALVQVTIGSKLGLTVINDCADDPLKSRDSLF